MSAPARRASATPVLEARDVHVHFRGTDSAGRPVTVRALDGVDLTLRPGQISALVGESGSGKTTLARLFALINRPTSGEILYNGTPVRVRGGRAERAYYSRVQLIYQDPFASLNGLKKVRTIISRVVRIHAPEIGRKGAASKAAELLERVNMTPASRYLDRYPTDMSGGQRQRIAIARALAVGPTVLLADEPTSMLDASIRLDVLNLLSDLRESLKVAVLYITHDIASARYLSDRIHVMYGGRIIESGPTEEIITSPVHPYTKLLLGAAPDPGRFKGSGRPTHTEITDARPVDTTTETRACRFAARCPLAMPQCTAQPLPLYRRTGEPAVAQRPGTEDDGTDHTVQCWLADDDPSYERVG